jgi:hypothetical protein
MRHLADLSATAGGFAARARSSIKTTVAGACGVWRVVAAQGDERRIYEADSRARSSAQSR